MKYVIAFMVGLGIGYWGSSLLRKPPGQQMTLSWVAPSYDVVGEPAHVDYYLVGYATKEGFKTVTVSGVTTQLVIKVRKRGKMVAAVEACNISGCSEPALIRWP